MITVQELILELAKYPPSTKVVILKDVEASGYGFVVKIKRGVFEMTDYGNDFYEGQTSPYEGQVKAICLVPDNQSWLTQELSEVGRTIPQEKKMKN